MSILRIKICSLTLHHEKMADKGLEWIADEQIHVTSNTVVDVLLEISDSNQIPMMKELPQINGK